MITPILHIGYPKTATKWFQQIFYPMVKDAVYIPRPFLFEHFVFKDIFTFSSSETRKYFFKYSDGKRIIICDEVLVGGLDIGFGSGEFVKLMVDRLSAVFENAQIVVLIRNQHTALESAYSHYIMTGGTYSPERYFKLKTGFSKPFMGYPLFSPKLFEYSKLLGFYEGLFGKSSLKVFLYEDFADNPSHFVEQFCSAIKIEVPEGISFERLNKRYSCIALQKQRFLNRFSLGNTPFKQYFINIPQLYGISRGITQVIDRCFNFKPYRFNAKIHRWIEEYYAESNRNLEKWVDPEKLKRWSYPLKK